MLHSSGTYSGGNGVVWRPSSARQHRNDSCSAEPRGPPNHDRYLLVGGLDRGGAANRTIKAPDSLRHRYYEEDLPFALTPFVALAGIAGVSVPMAHALLTCGSGLLGRDLVATGLGAAGLGIEGLDFEGLVELVGGSR